MDFIVARPGLRSFPPPLRLKRIYREQVLLRETVIASEDRRNYALAVPPMVRSNTTLEQKTRLRPASAGDLNELNSVYQL